MYGSLGAQIRHYRRIKEMTQGELARQVGYQTKASISKIEKNQATVPHDMLVKISNALNVDIDILTGRKKDDGEVAPPPAEAIAQYAYNSTSDTAKALRDHLLSAMKLLEQQPQASDIADKYNRLTPANQKSVMALIDSMLLQQQKAHPIGDEVG